MGQATPTIGESLGDSPLMAHLNLPANSILCTSMIAEDKNERRYCIYEDETPLTETIFADESDEQTITIDRGSLFQWLQREYGRCTGKVYQDDKSGKSNRVGWVFLSRRQYDDCRDTYLAETWVSLSTKIVTPTIYNPIALS